MKGAMHFAESPASDSLSVWNFMLNLVVIVVVPFSPTKQERPVKHLSAVIGIGY